MNFSTANAFRIAHSQTNDIGDENDRPSPYELINTGRADEVSDAELQRMIVWERSEKAIASQRIDITDPRTIPICVNLRYSVRGETNRAWNTGAETREDYIRALLAIQQK